MPIADDVTTGAKGPKPSLLQELKDKAAGSPNYGGSTTPAPSSSPTPSGAIGAMGASGTYGASQTAASEIGMLAGALTTVPEVEEYEPGKTIAERSREGLTMTPFGARPPGNTGSPSGYSLEDKQESQEAAAFDIAREASTEADKAAQQRRMQRAAMNLGGKRQRTEALTADEYAAFTPKQKAAIDLNTMLVEAVTSDLKLGKDIKVDGDYAGDVEDIFGKTKDAPYAPQTVELLDTIGADLEGFNLNQVLKLKGGFTRDDLSRLGDKPREGEAPDASLTTPQTVRNDLQDALASTLMATRRDPANGAAMLQVQQELTGTDKMAGAGQPGVLNPDGTVSGTMEQQRNFQFQRAFNALISPELKGQQQRILSDMREMTGEEWPMFLDFVGARLREAKQYDLDLDGNPTTEQRKPGGLIKQLGL